MWAAQRDGSGMAHPGALSSAPASQSEHAALTALGTDVFYVGMKENKVSLLSSLLCILRGPDLRELLSLCVYLSLCLGADIYYEQDNLNQLRGVATKKKKPKPH